MLDFLQMIYFCIGLIKRLNRLFQPQRYMLNRRQHPQRNSLVCGCMHT